MIRELKILREEITSVDKEILSLLTKRMELVGEIAEYKGKNNLPIFDPIREKEIIETYSEEVDFNILEIYQAIMDESKRLQKEKISIEKHTK